MISSHTELSFKILNGCSSNMFVSLYAVPATFSVTSSKMLMGAHRATTRIAVGSPPSEVLECRRLYEYEYEYEYDYEYKYEYESD